MDDKLITLAIHTFEKAQILKTILETEGIEVYIHNVNQIQPVISAGVRVRIKESDLPHALRIIEDSKWLDETVGEPPSQKDKIILIPVDFSTYSMKACEIGLNYAGQFNARVVIMHAYITPYSPASIPIGDTLAYKVDESLSIQKLLERVENEMEILCNAIDNRMESGELPKTDYEHILMEGLPEDEILSFCKKRSPALIIMGTRGKSQKEIDLIGSVTGEIIELSKIPVLAVPENVPFNNLNKASNIAFATSFNQRDLVAFDTFVGLTNGYKPNINLFNISTSHDEWDEIRLGGIREYFKKQYPEANISHTVLADGDLLPAIEKFVREKQIEIIAMTAHRRNVLSRIFNPGIARKMLFHTDTPLLIIPA